MLPFTQHQFFEVFARYNEAIWPAQLAAYGLGLLALAPAGRASRALSRFTLLSLAALWLWTGVVYHGVFFAEINPAATLFGVLFAAQTALLGWSALRPPIVFHDRMSTGRLAGWAMIVYAVALYPIVNAASGHLYPHAPSFGLTPCPLVIFTFGVLALSQARTPWSLFVVPVAWAIIGGSAAVLLGVVADWALPATAVLGLIINARKVNAGV